MLSEAGIRPSRRRGQSFLIDANLLTKLVESADLTGDEVVLEVGSGTGSLTAMLAERAARVVTIEIDAGLAALAQRRVAGFGNVTWLVGDALARKSELNPALVEAVREAVGAASGLLLLVANLPYGIASPLIADLLLGDLPVARMCVTIQREVADRLVARPGTPDYGALSVLVQTAGRVRNLALLRPEVFWPRPKVFSRMLRLDVAPEHVADPGRLRSVMCVARTGFTQRRKHLRRVLASRWPIEQVDAAMEAAGLARDARAESVPVEAWQVLAAHLSGGVQEG